MTHLLRALRRLFRRPNGDCPCPGCMLRRGRSWPLDLGGLF
jgi:hypothetical protein